MLRPDADEYRVPFPLDFRGFTHSAHVMASRRADFLSPFPPDRHATLN